MLWVINEILNWTQHAHVARSAAFSSYLLSTSGSAQYHHQLIDPLSFSRAKFTCPWTLRSLLFLLIYPNGGEQPGQDFYAAIQWGSSPCPDVAKAEKKSDITCGFVDLASRFMCIRTSFSHSALPSLVDSSNTMRILVFENKCMWTFTTSACEILSLYCSWESASSTDFYKGHKRLLADEG